MNKKILQIAALETIVKAHKKQGKTIVTYNGSFDVLHIGHIKSIQEAKKQGDILIILLNSDASVKKYKSSKRPVVSERERCEVLAALVDTDYITLFDEITPKNILQRIKPDIHCNGSDWGENCVERDIVENNGGKIHILRWEEGYSTTSLIQKILHAYNTPLIQAVFLTQYSFTHEEEKALQNLVDKNYKIIFLGEEQIEKNQFITAHYLVHTGAYEEAIMQAVHDIDMSLNTSWIIGEEKEVVLGRNMNIHTIKLGSAMPQAYKLEPSYYAKNLLHALKFIAKKE